MSQTAATVERAYAVFRRYPRRLAGATMYWTLEDPLVRAIHDRVKTTRLAALDADTLRQVLWNATADAESLKHFLPRVFECIAAGSMSLADVAGRLAPDRVHTWPEDELRAIAAFVRSLADDPEAERLAAAYTVLLAPRGGAR